MANSETGTSTGNTLGAEYQVFLSFRGPDTRRGFTNVLYHDLRDAGIHVFIDDEELRPGERISGNLLRAIDDSRLYIPIFSPNYASSHWCLRELAKMVENTSESRREDGNEKVILPIFYNVKPDDVKLRTQLYSRDILNLEKKFSSKDIKTWQQALKKVGGISGLDLQNYTGDGDLSKTIVNEVVDRLKTRQREMTEDLVGMEVRIAAISNLLDSEADGVQLIGIYGMGGMGKTTLAQKIYNQLCPRFGKSCSFLDDVRETAKTKGLLKLQEKLLSDISNSRVARYNFNSHDMIKAIGEIICNNKVLIVLDDVDDGNQIRKLIGMNSLYPGTRILVTTRDKRVLKIRGFKYEIEPYEMEELSDKDSLQLFSRHAFDHNSPPTDYYTLSKDIVSTASGLPLALQAIGSSLFGQEDKKVWEEVLEELRKTPHDDVFGKLRITYYTLKLGQQQIFLDIACFLIGKNKTDPIYMWKACGFSPEDAIHVLINRCVIKVLDNNKFWMHDQFRDLGRAIANKECSRLLDEDDIIRKLRSKEVNKSVQALVYESRGGRGMTVTPKKIKRFTHLRLLWLDNINFEGNFRGCLSELKWIELNYGSVYRTHDPQFLATNLHLENVVVMYICGYAWTDEEVCSLIKGAKKLKVLNLQGSPLRNRTLTFSKYSVLEKLTINCSGFLKEIDCSIEKLQWLTDLVLDSCVVLEKLPEQIGELKNLRHLSLMGCHSLRELPRLPGSLTTLDFSSNSLQTVPDLSNLTNLVELYLSDASLFSNTSNIIQPSDLPWIGMLSKLRKQHLCLLNVRATSTEWCSLSLLEELTLCGLDLQTLKQLPSNLTVLLLDKTQVKQAELDGLPQLETLTIRRCKLVTRISITSSLRKLRQVKVSSCTELVEVRFLGVLISLEELLIEHCKSLERLVNLLEEPRCNELQAPELTDGWWRVSLISSSLKMLRKLELWNCPELQEIQFASTLESLKEFDVKWCNLLKRLGGLSNLKNLKHLGIRECESLQVVEGIDELEYLHGLNVCGCASLERFIDASSSKIPNECLISISRCGKFDTWYGSSIITWKSYRKKITNGPIQGSHSEIETTDSKTETGDPLLKEDQENKEKKREREMWSRQKQVGKFQKIL